jgi:hypothetical protein
MKRPASRNATRFLTALFLAVLAVPLASCIGGTGTDTENGVVRNKGPLAGHDGTALRVTDGEGRPLAGVSLTLNTPGFRPDSGAPENLLLDSAKALVTDSLGYSKFHLAAPGKFVVEGRLGDTTLFFDTVAVSDVKALAAYTFRRHPAAGLKGRIRLASGLKVVAGKVILRGTARQAALAADGTYDLGALPPEVADMAFGLTYKTAVLDARVAEQKPDTGRVPGVMSKPVYTCRTVPVDSAARLSAQPDGVEKTVPFGPAFVAKDTLKLDTAKVAAVDRACDAVPGGTVIAVRSSDASFSSTKRDTTTTNLIAVDQGMQKAALSTEVMAGAPDPTLVPLNGCVALPGTTTTTFDLRLNPVGSSTDLLVPDIAGKCLAK